MVATRDLASKIVDPRHADTMMEARDAGFGVQGVGSRSLSPEDSDPLQESAASLILSRFVLSFFWLTNIFCSEGGGVANP